MSGHPITLHDAFPIVADKTVQGGHALRVKIPGADAKAWTISLSDPIEKPVKKGDKLVLAFYARATKSEAADGGAHLPNNGVQLARERSEEHTYELQSLMRISTAVLCVKKKTQNTG